MKAVIDFLLFRKMLAPVILQILFWSGIGGTLYGTYWLFIHDNWAWWMALVFGSLMTRLIFEFAVLRFQSYARLRHIETVLDELVKRERTNPTWHTCINLSFAIPQNPLRKLTDCKSGEAKAVSLR